MDATVNYRSYYTKKNIKTWLLRCKSNFLLANEGIDKGRLAHVRATKNRELGPVVFGAILCPPTALHELHFLNPGVTRVGANHDVGAGQDHVLGDFVRVDSRRHKQDGPNEPGGIRHGRSLRSL